MGTRLVGRIELLDQARLLALEGRGVLFAGEPGVGKTRLLTETLERLSADDGWHTERFVATAATAARRRGTRYRHDQSHRRTPR